MNHAFKNAINLNTLPNTKFPENTLTANGCFENCTSLKQLPQFFSLNSKLVQINDFFRGSGLKNINAYFQIQRNIQRCSGLFADCVYLSGLNENFKFSDDSKVTHLNSFFERCTKLYNFNANLNLPKTIISCENMFANCVQLSYLPYLNMTNITGNGILYLNNMFKQCQKLSSIPDFNFSNRTSLLSINTSRYVLEL